MPHAHNRKLPRLPPNCYKDRVSVFWTHSMENRASGWLIPGYFSVNPRQANYWDLFWRIHNKLVQPTPQPHG
ncbi:MAG: hypothetical protein AAGB46_18470 [Verrucomicrobiota bacterium]